jgi:hypothetical protein
MAVWPEALRGAGPSPQQAAALLALGELPAERVPWWAAAWLADGLGAEATAEIAGLDGRDPHAIRDLLPAVLSELNAPVSNSPAASATLAFSHLASLCLQGLASEYWVTQKVEEIVIRNSCAPEITALPLGPLYGLTDEWDAGWGRTRDELAATVHRACREQIALTEHR